MPGVGMDEARRVQAALDAKVLGNGPVIHPKEQHIPAPAHPQVLGKQHRSAAASNTSCAAGSAQSACVGRHNLRLRPKHCTPDPAHQAKAVSPGSPFG